MSAVHGPSASTSAVCQHGPSASMSAVCQRGPSAGMSAVCQRGPSAGMSAVCQRGPSAGISAVCQHDLVQSFSSTAAWNADTVQFKEKLLSVLSCNAMICSPMLSGTC